MADLRELQMLGDTLNRAVGGTSAGLRRLNELLNDTNIDLRREHESKERELVSLSKWNKKYDDRRMDNIRTLEEEANARREMIRRNQDLTIEYRRTETKRIAEIQKLRQTWSKIEADRAKGTNTWSDYHYELERRRYEKQISELEAQAVTVKEVERLNKVLTTEVNTIQKEINQQRADLERFEWKDVFGKLKTKITSGLSRAIQAAFDPQLLSDGLKGMLAEARQVMATGGDWIYSELSRRVAIADLAMNADDYIKMNAEFRQLILSVGGVDNHLKTLSEAMPQIQHQFEQPALAAAYASKMLDNLSKSGIAPTTQNLNRINTSFVALNKLTGMTGEKFNEVISELVSSDEIQGQMRLLNQRQRMQMLDSIAIRAKENEAIGIGIEKTLSMAKATSKMGEETFRERHQRAARLEVASNALGLGTMGSQLAALVRKQQGQWSDGEREFFQRAAQELNRRLAELRASGNPMHEIYADQLEQAVVKQQDIFGRSSVFAAANLTEETRRIANTAEDALKVVAGTQNEVPDLIKDVSDNVAYIRKILDDKLVWTIAGGFGAVVAALGGRRAMEIGKMGIDKLLGRKGASTVATTTAEKIAEKEAVKTGAKLGGKALLKAIPILGILAGVGYGVSRLLDGDIVGAGMEVASGVAGTVPGVGTAASVGIETTLAARDFGVFDSKDTVEARESKPVLGEDTLMTNHLLSVSESINVVGDTLTQTLIYHRQAGETTKQQLLELNGLMTAMVDKVTEIVNVLDPDTQKRQTWPSNMPKAARPHVNK